MLSISATAAEAINEIMDANEVPEEGGVRISVMPSEDSAGPTIGLSLVPAPAEEDQVVTDEGAQLFVAPELQTELDDKRLDAAVEGEGVTFAFQEQAT